MVASAAYSVYPFVLPALPNTRYAFTIDDAAAPLCRLELGLV